MGFDLRKFPETELDNKLIDRLVTIIKSGHVDEVLDYNGDDELISSVNAEYTFDPDDIICTDGFFVSTMHTENIVGEHGICVLSAISNTTALRGASYLIIYSMDHKRLSVRLDRSRLCPDTCVEIVNKVNKLYHNLPDIAYYAKKWRCGTPLQNPCSIDDIYTH